MKILVDWIKGQLCPAERQVGRRHRRGRQMLTVAVVERLEGRVLLSATITSATAGSSAPTPAAPTDPTIFVALFSGAGTSAGEVTGMSQLGDYLEVNVPDSVAVAFAPGPSGYNGKVVASQVNNQLLIPYHFDEGVDTIVLIGHSYGGDLIRTITDSRAQRGLTLPNGLVFYDPIDQRLVNRRLDLDQSNNPHNAPRGMSADKMINYVQRTDLVIRGYDLIGLQSTVITGLGTSAHTAIDEPSAGTYDDVAAFVISIAAAASQQTVAKNSGSGDAFEVSTMIENVPSLSSQQIVSAGVVTANENSAPSVTSTMPAPAAISATTVKGKAVKLAVLTAKNESHNTVRKPALSTGVKVKEGTQVSSWNRATVDAVFADRDLVRLV